MADTTNYKITLLGTDYTVTGDGMRSFAVGVPHQRPAYIDVPAESPPIAEDGDNLIEGDHDLHHAEMVETFSDAVRLIEADVTGTGHQRHQIASLIVGELRDQGVIEAAGEIE